jgi:hypothetical protein
MAREAAYIAESVLYELSNEFESLSSIEEDVEGKPGWSYRLEVRDLVLNIKAEDQEEKEIAIPELKELVLTVQPPYNAHSFVLTSWIPAEEI